jgi:hypothetical protein
MSCPIRHTIVTGPPLNGHCTNVPTWELRSPHLPTNVLRPTKSFGTPLAPILNYKKPKGYHMKKLTSALVLAGFMAFGSSDGTSWARVPDSHVLPQDQIRARLTDRQIQTILSRIRTNAESLLTAMDGTRSRGRIFGGNRQTGSDAYLVDDLVQASIHLSDHVTRRETTRTDVDDFLSRADAVDDALTRNPGSTTVQNTWRTIRRDVESLASAYSITWDWQNPTYPGIPGSGIYQRLTGTYQLDTTRSENPQRVIDNAVRGVAVANRARVTRQLTRRLEPPDMLAIDRNGNQVIIGSSLGPQVTLSANGQAQTETTPAGGTLTTRATLYGDQLEVTTTGGANLDYAVTFEPTANGRDLAVTRRIYTDALNQPVTLRSVYRRTSETPDWTLSDRAGTINTEPSGMLVPDGALLTARLDQNVNLRTARDDDRITLVVHNAPRAELEGATIEGYVRRTTDDKGVVFYFDQIRLRNGRYSEFDGVIESMVGPNGENVPFNGESANTERSQTRESIERGAIGAAVGTILGAIIGGTKGAVIGAVLGGGGAVATVLTGVGAEQLNRGTEVTIRARAR